MAKQLLAFVLALAMLCGFGAIGASASTELRPATDEESILAMQYLTETAEIINSKRFTLKAVDDWIGYPAPSPFHRYGSNYFVEVRDGDRIALKTCSYRNLINDFLCGEWKTTVWQPDKTQYIFRERGWYAERTEQNKIKNYYIPDSIDTVIPFVVKADDPDWLFLCGEMTVYPYTYPIYTYRGGVLYNMWGLFKVDELSAAPDDSYFSTKGLVKVPYWLYKLVSLTF